MTAPTPTQIAFLHTMKGAPLAILTLMLFCPPPPKGYSNQELCRYINYSDKTIANALWLLEKHKAITQTPSGRWLPTAAFNQLPLFEQAPGIASGALPQTTSGIASDTPNQNTPGIASGETSRRRISVIEGKVDGNSPSHPPLSFSSSSTLLITGEEERKEIPRDLQRKISAFAAQHCPDQRTQTYWELLTAAGIGSHSTKMAEILALGLRPDFLIWHIAARQAKPNDYPPQHMIVKLLNGEEPPLKWGEHLDLLAQHFPEEADAAKAKLHRATTSRYIPPALADIIQR